MSNRIAGLLADHVELATPVDAASYLIAVILWLAGVVFVVMRKLRMWR